MLAHNLREYSTSLKGRHDCGIDLCLWQWERDCYVHLDESGGRELRLEMGWDVCNSQSLLFNLFPYNRFYLQNVPKYPKRVLMMETKWPNAWACKNTYTQTIILETLLPDRVSVAPWSCALYFSPAQPHQTVWSPAKPATLCLLCPERSASHSSPCGLSVKGPPQVRIFKHLGPS